MTPKNVTQAFSCLTFSFFVTACVAIVSPYDITFDQTLNKLSQDTSTFLAAASAGGSERGYSSKETVAYYASTYNVLDRLEQRARLTRAMVACPTDATLRDFAAVATSRTQLPPDYLSFDCREFQLYAVQFYVDQLHYAHENDGVLNKSEVNALGGTLQASIMGAIQTFLVNKPEKA
ncbi:MULTISPECIES: hypothetical protein [unclassified Mesorhizobium]|uniref:hypothetical protein n=1 Tax=unclassified Mesorhizobium TaxID=325217 RepID=UPI003338D8DB